MSCKPEELLDFLKSRRSIRKFKPTPVPKDLIQKILDTARYAPSAGNRQPWRFIVVDDPSIKEQLANVHPWAWPLKEAPQAIVVVSDKNVSPVSYLVDGANATIYIQLAAHALGLGTVWLQTLRNIEDIQRILNLPENLVPVAMLAIGYPDEQSKPKERLPLEELVYYNKYPQK
ncbi:MAG: nitroreductase family protein [Thermoprotei archaeon]|nr:MAG: nitroreductase family protein [Thermoprotei archaeon]